MAGEPDDVDTMVEPVVPSRHRWLAGLLAALPGDRVVDLGCGTGSTLAQVEAGLALGLDVSSAALARAAELTSRPSARPASTCARVLPVPQPRSTTRSPGRAASSPASQRCRLGTTGSTIVSTSSGSPAMGGT